MRVLIDIGHPAHVHLFKYFAWEMQKKRHEIFFTCRDKEFEINLLRHYGFQFQSFGKKYNTRTGKIWGLFKFDYKEFICGLHFKPDMFLSHGSMYAAHTAFLSGKPHISIEDTGNWEQVKLYLPFTSAVITSDNFPHNYKEKQIRIRSHNEIAYLHPQFFHPDPLFKETLDLKLKEKFIILRFVAWNASHDIGQTGLAKYEKLKIVESLSKDYKVLISSESDLPAELEKNRISFNPHEVHDALFYADMFIGEGTTMAMEAAILGTPSVYVNTLQYSNVMDMEKHGLLFNLSHVQKREDRIVELLRIENLKDKLKENRRKMLAEKINITAFLVWFVENWPESFKMMKKNPEYQERFK